MTHKGKSLYDDLTPEQIQEVEKMASVGCSNKLIAECLGVPVSTFHDCVKLRKICAQKRALFRRNIRVDQVKHSKNTPVGAIWLGKNELGQTDKQEVRHGVSEETATLLALIDGASKGLLPSEE